MHTHSIEFEKLRCGPQRRFKSFVMFACEGKICTIAPDGSIELHRCDDMLDRAIALDAMKSGLTDAKYGELPAWRRQEWRQLEAGAQAIKECVKEAKFMGDPHDPRAVAEMAKAAGARPSLVAFGTPRDHMLNAAIPGPRYELTQSAYNAPYYKPRFKSILKKA